MWTVLSKFFVWTGFAPKGALRPYLGCKHRTLSARTLVAYHFRTLHELPQLGSDPEVGCIFQNVPAKTDLMDAFRGEHTEKIAI